MDVIEGFLFFEGGGLGMRVFVFICGFVIDSVKIDILGVGKGSAHEKFEKNKTKKDNGRK